MSERNLDFDALVERRGTQCLKYDFAVERNYPEDVLPLWVADMDFRTSSYIEDALVSLAHHNIYGYTNTKKDFFDAVAGWLKRHHDFDVEYEWNVKTPGVCFAISNALRTVTQKGDAVIINQPVYYPFSSIILQQGRKRISSDLVNDGNGYYTIDFDDFEKKIVENNVKLYILCNPHNPVGRVWSPEELLKLGNICKKHGVYVFSDEIHSDFVWKGKHTVFQTLDKSFEDFTITATAPSKTFNLAGLQQSNIFISNKKLRDEFINQYEISGLDEPNVAGVVAAKAAYTNGDEWYEAMKKYVKSNIDYSVSYVRENLPGVKVWEPEGTYLLWLDFNALGLSEKELEDRIVNKAKLWLDSGHIFGKSGDGFERINVAAPISTVKECLRRIRENVY
ncbi:MAG: pyridoxal phosphate-dependent aminotransferase [Lachnospiraceae bacterium]|nr:pyridoxal phosphate-dependent aminotransferase [Lachnospiraceae bacterium]